MRLLLSDIRYSIRSLLKNGRSSLIAVVVLALGIGANTAIFTLVDRVLLRPLPYEDPGRLVALVGKNRQADMGSEVAPANYLDWRAGSGSFESLCAYAETVRNLTGSDTPEQFRAGLVSPSCLAALGVRPALGRPFLPEDEAAEAAPVVLLGQGVWRLRFGADPGIVGQTIVLNGNPHTVVGVMPEGFRFPTPEAQIWVPYLVTPSRTQDRQSRYLYVLGRLKPEVGLAAAQQEMNAVTARLEQAYPADNADWGVELVPLSELIVGDVRTALLLLQGIVLLILGIACANLANLQLAQAVTRQREVAIRSAVGARFGQLMRQTLVGSAVLALAGGVLGLLLAAWSLDALVALRPSDLPRIDEIRIDGTALLFTLAISILTGLVFGLFPAFAARRSELTQLLKEGGKSGGGGRRHQGLRKLLTVAEVAAASLLLVGAGLMIKSFVLLQRVDPGFQAQGVLTAEINLPSAKYSETAQISSFFNRVAEAARNLPGVEAAGVVSHLPLSGANMTYGFTIDGRPQPASGPAPEAAVRVVTAGYLETLRITVAQGRSFTARDRADSPKVVIVNRSLAERYWPGKSPLGERIFLDSPEPREVVGVVSDIRHAGLDRAPDSEIYVPYDQEPYPSGTVVLRAPSGVEGLQAGLRERIREIDADQPITRIRELEDVLAESISRPSFYTSLLSAFAGLALILAALGIYSLISYWVAQRTHEIGIRMALGAERNSVLALVLRQGMTLALTGIAIGLALALLTSKLLSSLLFGVVPTDLAVFVLAALFLSLVALAATYLPARRATGLSPMLAFRQD